MVREISEIHIKSAHGWQSWEILEVKQAAQWANKSSQGCFHESPSNFNTWKIVISIWDLPRFKNL